MHLRALLLVALLAIRPQIQAAETNIITATITNTPLATDTNAPAASTTNATTKPHLSPALAEDRKSVV